MNKENLLPYLGANWLRSAIGKVQRLTIAVRTFVGTSPAKPVLEVSYRITTHLLRDIGVLATSDETGLKKP